MAQRLKRWTLRGQGHLGFDGPVGCQGRLLVTLSGPVGCGKSLVAKILKTILPLTGVDEVVITECPDRD